MYEITKAVSKFYDELHNEGFEPELSYTLTQKYANALISDYGESSNLQAEISEECENDTEDDDEEVDSTATIYVDVVPRFDKIKEAIAKLNED